MPPLPQGHLAVSISISVVTAGWEYDEQNPPGRGGDSAKNLTVRGAVLPDPGVSGGCTENLSFKLYCRLVGLLHCREF